MERDIDKLVDDITPNRGAHWPTPGDRWPYEPAAGDAPDDGSSAGSPLVPAGPEPVLPAADVPGHGEQD